MGTIRTKQQIKIGGQLMGYTVTTGYMRSGTKTYTLKAKLFLCGLYQRRGNQPGKRPILFAYNGGPGSASLWLHMGALGPKRVVIGDSAIYLRRLTVCRQ